LSIFTKLLCFFEFCGSKYQKVVIYVIYNKGADPVFRRGSAPLLEENNSNLSALTSQL